MSDDAGEVSSASEATRCLTLPYTTHMRTIALATGTGRARRHHLMFTPEEVDAFTAIRRTAQPHKQFSAGWGQVHVRPEDSTWRHCT